MSKTSRQRHDEVPRVTQPASGPSLAPASGYYGARCLALPAGDACCWVQRGPVRGARARYRAPHGVRRGGVARAGVGGAQRGARGVQYFIQEVRGFSQERRSSTTRRTTSRAWRGGSATTSRTSSTPSMSSSGGMPSPTASAAPTRRRGGAGTFSWGATTSPSPTSSRRRCVASAADRCERRRGRPP